MYMYRYNNADPRQMPASIWIPWRSMCTPLTLHSDAPALHLDPPGAPFGRPGASFGSPGRSIWIPRRSIWVPRRSIWLRQRSGSAPGGQTRNTFGALFASKSEKCHLKRHSQINAENIWNLYAKGYQNEAIIIRTIVIFLNCPR